MLGKLVLLLSIGCSVGIALTSCTSSEQPNSTEIPDSNGLSDKNTSNNSGTTTTDAASTSKNAPQGDESQVQAPAPSPSPASSTDASRPPLTTEKLKNTEYFFLAKGPIKLKNGEYKDEATQRTYTLSDVISYGDLNRDGIKDAVTALKVVIPNTGTFSYLVALVNEAGTPKNISSEFMGREIRVKTLKVNSDRSIEAVLQQYQPGDPECCPSVEIQRTYKLRDNQTQSSDKAQPPK